MALTTGGTPYVTSTDLVANYPTSSLALANRTDVVASGGPVLVKTAGYTITIADILGGNKFLYNSASPGTFTLPTSSLVDGMVIDVSQIGAGALTVSGGTIVGTTVTTSQYQGLRFVYVASGTTWYSIAPNATAPGLAIVSPTSIANSGGSASASGGAVTFTGVSSISLNGVFSATYDNYRITFEGIAASNLSVRARMRASGTDNTTASSYNRQRVFSYLGTTLAASNETDNIFPDLVPLITTATGIYSMDIYRPFLAADTVLGGIAGVSTDFNTHLARHNQSTSYDGISFITSTSTMTGKLRVYGYKNS
jgi:hypothetical protein